jgi:hypothetical protein
MPTHATPRTVGTDTRAVSRALVVAVSLGALGLPITLSAQCIGDLARETTALESLSAAIKDAALKPIPAGTNKTYWEQFQDALSDDGLYGQHTAKAGGAQPCLQEKKELFRSAAREALLSKLGGKTGDLAIAKAKDVEEALRTGAFSALATRYSPSDRFGVFFGFGSSYVPKKSVATRFKVVSQSEMVTTPASASTPASTTTLTKQYAVVASDSRSRPVGTTGLAMRFRDRRSDLGGDCARKGAHDQISDCLAFAMDRVWPTTVFGSIQFGGGEGFVSGTTLGLGWKVVGDVNLLVGLGVTEIPTLRRELRAQFEANKEGRLLVPAGESSESIMGTQTERSWMFALGIPLALRNALSGR